MGAITSDLASSEHPILSRDPKLLRSLGKENLLNDYGERALTGLGVG